MLNLAAHVMVMQEDTKDKQQMLHDQLEGRFRTLGPPVPPEDEHAPSWWHGDDEAYELTMAAVGGPTGRR